jgi:hypothetical protein
MPKHLDIDDYLDSLAEPARGIGAQLRSLVDAALPDADAKLWHGHPVWMAGMKPLAGFKAYTAHVTFMIWNGSPIADDSARLEQGPHMATVKVRAAADIDRTTFAGWIRAAHAAGVVVETGPS